MAEDILKNLARSQVDRYFRSSVKVRPRLGSTVDIHAVQDGVLGALMLSPSMGPVLYETGRRIAFQIAEEARSITVELPDYRSIAKSKNLDQAKLSTEFTNLQTMFQGDGCGLLRMTEYRKGKLIVFQVQECAECFGIAKMRRAMCYFTGGKLAGAIQSAFHKEVGSVETKCSAKGDPCCEFKYTFQKG